MRCNASLAAAALAALVAAGARTAAQTGEIATWHVQGNVHLVYGAGANVAIQVGDDGILVVDTGVTPMADKVVAAIQKLSTKPLRWIVNTNGDPDHTGGNERLSRAGRTVNGNPAAIHSHLNVLNRMDKSGVPESFWPLNTFAEPSKDFSFNDEAVFMHHVPHAHTDGDVLVYFPRSDVIVAGDVFMTTVYPAIDTKNGGSVEGSIAALNRILDLAVPKRLQEGGTYIIPGHGRISDEADVVEYRDMLLIVRDRIRDMIKRGMTLEQVKASKVTIDYDPRYAAPSGPSTRANFIESVYQDLNRKK